MAIIDASGFCNAQTIGYGHIVKLVKLVSVVAINSTRVRFTFDRPMKKDAGLLSKYNYQISPTTPGAVTPFIDSVETENELNPTYVDLITSEMTDSAVYDGEVNTVDVVDLDGTPVDPAADTDTFTGIGVQPEISQIIAVSENRVDVVFTEQMEDNDPIRTPARYGWDSGLSTISILGVDAATVQLVVGDQIPGQLYTLTLDIVGGAIQDLAKNSVPSGHSSQMIGYTEPPSPEEVLKQLIYFFFLEPIRQEDAKREGAFFLKRYLEGPQQLWKQTQQKIFDIKKLWSLTECPDEFLPYLKNIVGWTDDLNYITDALEPPALRRLIAASIPLWKQRGREEALLNILALMTGARCRIWNWFDYMWISDETELGEEHEGRDPWMIKLPGPPDYDEYYSTLRIVDDGDLNRDLVIGMAKFMRAISERIEVVYVNFMDRFMVADDLSQWDTLTGASFLIVESGRGRLIDDTEHQSVLGVSDNSLIWNDYIVYWRILGSGAEFGCYFYYQDSDNYYSISIDISTRTITLKKTVSGVTSAIGSYSFPASNPLYEDVWYGIRVHIETEGASNRIVVFIDSGEIINTTDPDLDMGSVGWYHTSGSKAELDEIELFQLPLEAELIDINS